MAATGPNDNRIPAGVAAYLRSVAVRCARLSRVCGERGGSQELEALSLELAEKASRLEELFAVPPANGSH
jgi:hypothetical protein